MLTFSMRFINFMNMIWTKLSRNCGYHTTSICSQKLAETATTSVTSDERMKQNRLYTLNFDKYCLCFTHFLFLSSHNTRNWSKTFNNFWLDGQSKSSRMFITIAMKIMSLMWCQRSIAMILPFSIRSYYRQQPFQRWNQWSWIQSSRQKSK